MSTARSPRPSAGDPTAELPDWQRALAGAVPAAAAPEAADATEATPLGLQFQLREMTPRSTERWNGPTSRPAAPGSTGRLRLGVRPVLRTARGWARGTLTWTNLPHMRNRLSLDAEQHRWSCQFVAMHRAAGPPVPGQDTDWVYLDEFVSPAFWPLLAEGLGTGIALLGSKPNDEVVLGSRAELSLDLAADPAGGLLLAPALAVDGEAWSAADARPIGAHGVAAIRRGPVFRARLAPSAQPLSAAEVALLDAGGRAGGLGAGIAVPAGETADFLSGYLPELRAAFLVGSADGSVPLPAPEPAGLVLTLSPSGGRRLGLDWSWRAGARGAAAPSLAAVLPEDALPAAWLPTGWREIPAALPLPLTLDADAAVEFVSGALPELRGRRGITVVERSPLPAYRELSGELALTLVPVLAERQDWFDLGVEVRIDGRLIPFAPLFRALSRGSRTLRLVDDSVLRLDRPVFARLRELIEASTGLDEWETGLRVSRYQATLLAEFEDHAEEAPQVAAWRELVRAARSAGPEATPPPAGLLAELRPYQAEGFSWLAFLWRQRLGGVLADEMGLGKTLQCLALVQHAANERRAADPAGEPRPVLVVAPTSVVAPWAAEAARFAPGLTVRTVTATARASGRSVAEAAAGADLVITSYAVFRLDAEQFRAVSAGPGWSALILDEAQFVKNAATRVHACALELGAPLTIAVTGTPLENSLTELHAILQLVAPGLFPSARRFAEEYQRPIEASRAGITAGIGAGEGPRVTAADRRERLGRLRQRIRPFLLRRTKAAVAPELPAKHERVLRVPLAPAHRELYDVFFQRERQKVLGLLEDLDRNRFIVFRSLTLLRMLALDPALIDTAHGDVPSAKLDALVERLLAHAASGRRALVFSQFTSYLARVEARLAAAGIDTVLLTGSTRDRPGVVAEFREGAAPVFLISLKAGGFGLTLTEADAVFLLDPWWNPAAEAQAIDRSHRIGQDAPVTVTRLIAADTIEEKVLALQERKAALFDAVVDDAELFGTAISAADIRGLLSP